MEVKAAIVLICIVIVALSGKTEADTDKTTVRMCSSSQVQVEKFVADYSWTIDGISKFLEGIGIRSTQYNWMGIGFATNVSDVKLFDDLPGTWSFGIRKCKTTNDMMMLDVEYRTTQMFNSTVQVNRVISAGKGNISWFPHEYGNTYSLREEFKFYYPQSFPMMSNRMMLPNLDNISMTDAPVTPVTTYVHTWSNAIYIPTLFTLLRVRNASSNSTADDQLNLTYKISVVKTRVIPGTPSQTSCALPTFDDLKQMDERRRTTPMMLNGYHTTPGFRNYYGSTPASRTYYSSRGTSQYYQGSTGTPQKYWSTSPRTYSAYSTTNAP